MNATAASRTALIEQMGLFAEDDGLPRIAGRVFGYLLLAEAPASLDDLADALGVSKASVSTDARLLLDRGLVERVSEPGDRRDYYHVAPDFFRRLLEHRIARWSTLRALSESYRARTPRPSAVVRRRLDYIVAAHQHIVGSLAGALADWDARALGAEESRR